MKNLNKLLFTLFITNILFSIQIVAQKVDINEHKYINEFYASFVKEMDKIGDIDRLPTEFFAEGFKKRLAEETILSISDVDLENVSMEERYKLNTSIHNFFYLLFQIQFDKKGKITDYYDIQGMLQDLPANILKKAKESILKDKLDGFEPKTISELKELVIKFDELSRMMRTFLNNRSVGQKQKYRKFWETQRKRQILDNSNTSSKLCEDDECFGLPEKTRIYALHAFTLCLRIAEVDGKYKVVAIFCALCED